MTRHRRLSARSPLAAVMGGLALVALFAPPAAAGMRPSAPVAPVATSAAAEEDAAAATTWALQPAGAEGPDGRVSLRVQLDPGAAVDERLALTNFSARPATFAVYARDGEITADGSFDLVADAAASTGGGAWIDLGRPKGAAEREGGGILVTVPAEKAVLIPVSITAPDTATPGDHPAGIVAELVPDGDAAVSLVSRVGVRAHLRVTGDIVPQLSADDVTATYEPSWNPFAPGTLTVRYTVANPGNIRLGGDSTMSFAGPWGIAAASAAHEQREVLPGAGAEVVTQTAVWPLVFGSGDVSVAPSLVGEDVADAELAAVSTPFTVWMMPWSQLALLALAAGSVVLIVRGRRRSRARVEERIQAAVAAATASRAEQ
jgi:hypothetical protein